MMWLLLAFLSAALLGFYDVFKKQSLKDNAVIPVLFLNTLFSSLIFLPFIVLSVWRPGILEDSILCACCRVGGASLCGVEICYCPFVVDIGIFWDEESAYHNCGTYNATRPVMVLVGALVVFGERLNFTNGLVC